MALRNATLGNGGAHAALTGRAPIYGSDFKLITVVMYHVVASATTFAADLDTYRAWNYTTVTPDEVAAYYAGTGALPEKPLLITFDDGSLTQYTNAYPQLLSRGMKGTIYVCSGWLDDDAGVNTSTFLEPSHFTWANAQEMHTSGLVEIQAHGHFHTPYAAMSGAQAAADFQTTKARIEQMVPGQVVRHMAYPYGSTSATVMKALRSAGCLTARYTRLSLNGVTDGSGPFGYASPYDDPMILPTAGTGAADLSQANFYNTLTRSPELIPDYGFEGGGQGWNFVAGFAVDTAEKHSGAQSIRNDQSSTTTVALTVAQPFPVGNHAALTGSVWIKNTVLGAANRVKVQLNTYKAEQTMIGTVDVVSVDTSIAHDWTQYTFTWRGDKTSYYVLPVLWVQQSFGGATGQVWFDDFSLKRSAAAGSLPIPF